MSVIVGLTREICQLKVQKPIALQKQAVIQKHNSWIGSMRTPTAVFQCAPGLDSVLKFCRIGVRMVA